MKKSDGPAKAVIIRDVNGDSSSNVESFLCLTNKDSKAVAKRISERIRDIQETYAECIGYSNHAIRAGISVGRKLREMREFIGRGHWERFYAERIEPETKISLRTAQRLFKLVDAWDRHTAKLGLESTKDMSIFDQSMVESFRIAHAAEQTTGRPDPNHWQSPIALIRAARELLGRIDLDPCGLENAPDGPPAAKVILPTDKDGLSQECPWTGRCWIAPGHRGSLASWIDKSLAEVGAKRMEAGLLLLPVNVTCSDSRLCQFPLAILKDDLPCKTLKVSKRKGLSPMFLWKEHKLNVRMAISYVASQPDIKKFHAAFGYMATVLTTSSM